MIGSPGPSSRRKGSWALKEEKGTNFFSTLHCFSHIRCFILNSELLGQKSLRLIFFTCLVTQSCPTLCNPRGCSLPGSSVHGDSLGKNTGEGHHALLQDIFPTQGSNPGLLHCRWTLLPFEPPGKPHLSLSPELMITKQNNSSCSRVCFSLSSVLMII